MDGAGEVREKVTFVVLLLLFVQQKVSLVKGLEQNFQCQDSSVGDRTQLYQKRCLIRLFYVAKYDDINVMMMYSFLRPLFWCQ